MNIRRGDNVKVMAGKDKGKTGKVMQVFPDAKRLVVEGAGMMTKHARVNKVGQKGQKLEFSGPIAVANVAVVCPKCSKPTRVGIQVLKDGDSTKRVRVCKKCKEAIE